MLAMVALFPTRQIGVEMGAILLIFTGQVWNMAFSFYSSIKSIPREMREAASIYQFSRLQRLVQLELPYSAIGLVWNSMVSVAGGWFFLMACEMFVLGTRDFRLPGLGSYLQTAAGTGNYAAIAWGLVTMIAIIVATDQLIWRPVIAWSEKFKFEQVESAQRVRSPLLHLLQHSRGLRSAAAAHDRAAERRDLPATWRRSGRSARDRPPLRQDADDGSAGGDAAAAGALSVVAAAAVLYAAWHARRVCCARCMDRSLARS